MFVRASLATAQQTRNSVHLVVGVLPDPDRAADEAGGIGVGFERVVGQEAGLVLVGPVIARAGDDGPKWRWP
jgi:hypothetical protein